MTALLAAIPVRPIAVGIVLAAFLVWLAFLLRLGSAGRPEGLPANIKPYLTDEELEDKKVVRTAVIGLYSSVAIGVIMVLYWLFIPRIQVDATDRYLRESVDRGKHYFSTTAEGGFNCAGCHGGGLGGKIDFTVAAGPLKGQKVTWEAPSLNDVYFRFSREEVKQILIFGRPGTPMPAWGLAGGGPLIDQQLEDILNYLKSIEVSYDDALKKVGTDNGVKISDGSQLFLKNCARCHTPNFSIIGRFEGPATTPTAVPITAEERAALAQGVGSYGPNLTNEPNQFPDIADQIKFIQSGSTANKPFGVRGIGNGRMPGFARNPAQPLLDEDQIRAVAQYERGLKLPADLTATASPARTTTSTATPAPSG